MILDLLFKGKEGEVGGEEKPASLLGWVVARLGLVWSETRVLWPQARSLQGSGQPGTGAARKPFATSCGEPGEVSISTHQASPLTLTQRAGCSWQPFNFR